MNLLLVLLGCKDPAVKDSAVEPVEVPVEEEVPESFEVTGQIVDDEGTPIADANVMVGGQPETLVLTDENGNFSLWYTNIHKGEPAIVASKLGYRAKGYEFFKFPGDVRTSAQCIAAWSPVMVQPDLGSESRGRSQNGPF